MAYLARALLTLTFLSAACGGGDGDDTGDAGPDVDAGPDGACGFDSDRYLPHQVGNTWTYRITDLGSGAVATKDQSVDEEIDDPTFGTVTVQTTGKINGSTRSLFKQDGERLLRMQQEDLDAGGLVERTTVYDPGQLRIDESAAALEDAATWDESYTATETEGVLTPVETSVVDTWTVLDAAVECDVPGVGTFSCLHIRKARAIGGTSTKEYWFARGVGKVRETGDSQIEELTACGVE